MPELQHTLHASANSHMSATLIIGRSSSHFTRIVRIFAIEMDIDHAFQIVRDLTSNDVVNYAGNPALKVPVLQNTRGSWFGALPICRELQRQSSRSLNILWPEQCRDSVQSNAQELVLQAMATEVNLIMANLSGNTLATSSKLQTSLRAMMSWLDEHSTDALTLPPHDLSFFEISLFCLLEHLEFRQILDVSGYVQLMTFRQQYAQRAACMATAFKYD